MLKKNVVRLACVIALILSSCSSSTSGSAPEELPEPTEPVTFQPIELSGDATLESLTAQIEQTRTGTQDLRATVAPLLYLLPEGDYGVDGAWVISLGSRLEHTAGRSWRGGEYEIVMQTTYQTDKSSYEDVVGRVRASTFTGKNELSLTDDSETSNSDPLKSDVTVTATQLVFTSSDPAAEEFTILVKKDTSDPDLVEVEVNYSLSPDSGAELTTYMETLSGWAGVYPRLEGGRIAKIEFNTIISNLVFDLQLPGEEPREQTIPVHFTFDYEFPASDTGERKDVPTVDAEVRESLEASMWTVAEGDGLSGAVNLVATTPDGAEHEVSIDQLSSTQVSYLHRVELKRSVN